MSIIPSGEHRTNLGARQHLLLYLNSRPTQGSTHLSATIDAGGPMWIGLYDGNGVDLIDSVSIPTPLAPNTSYARQKDGSPVWEVKVPDAVTPGIENYIQLTESKLSKIKRDDPHGFGITLLSMGIVFSCLALLWIFFTIFGKVMSHQQAKKDANAKAKHLERVSAVHDADDEDERAFPRVTVRQGEPDDNDVYVAVISMALQEHFDHSHDHESGVITILPKEHTKWTRI